MANKIIDYFIRFLVLASFLSFFFAPAPITWTLTLLNFFAVGLWAVLYPPGVMLWAKATHPELDETDPSLWWIPRLIGGAFMLMAVTFGLVFLLQR